jgi:hypothetical protein
MPVCKIITIVKRAESKNLDKNLKISWYSQMTIPGVNFTSYG